MVQEENSGEAEAIRPPWLHLLSAFLSMEPSNSIISISRDCGGGAITESVQNFIWDHCINRADGKGHVPYIRSFLKKLILEIESEGAVVIDELYEQLAFYMASLKGDDSAKGDSRIIRKISFLYPADLVESRACQSQRKLVVPLSCSLNMLEGDTGCSLWPSSLFLSEFILSCPELFSKKSCFELGSGVGLVGMCLAQVKPSKVVLSDGDLSTLANLKVNLELNQMNANVECLHLPWESALESDLQDLKPDIVLGADVIYDPQCITHLVRVISALLTIKKSNSGQRDECFVASRGQSVAYIASVVRNIDTFNYFLRVAKEANLRVVDITENVKMYNFLPYMRSYQRSSVRLLEICYTFH
ncbi:hypothetical protein LXL04_014127 [Taraxacum kok-saghyz]